MRIHTANRLRLLTAGLGVGLLAALWAAPVAVAQVALPGTQVSLPGTKDVKSPVKKAGNQIQDAVDAVKGTVDKAGATVKDTVDEAGATVKDTVDKAGSTVKDTVDRAGAAVKDAVRDPGARSRRPEARWRGSSGAAMGSPTGPPTPTVRIRPPPPLDRARGSRAHESRTHGSGRRNVEAPAITSAGEARRVRPRPRTTSSRWSRGATRSLEPRSRARGSRPKAR